VNIEEKRRQKVNVYDNGKLVAEVDYNDNLGVFCNFDKENQSANRYMGITRLEDSRYVLIYGTDVHFENNEAWIISPEKALREILESRRKELLELPIFAELKELRKTMPREAERGV